MVNFGLDWRTDLDLFDLRCEGERENAAITNKKRYQLSLTLLLTPTGLCVRCLRFVCVIRVRVCEVCERREEKRIDALRLGIKGEPIRARLFRTWEVGWIARATDAFALALVELNWIMKLTPVDCLLAYIALQKCNASPPHTFFTPAAFKSLRFVTC